MSLLSRLAVQAARAYGILSSRNTNVPASYLVVAGGGSGSSGVGGVAGGGGGAGGYKASTATLSTLNTYTVTVGAGGVGTTVVVGTSGSNSVLAGTGLTTVTSTGGGYGGKDSVAGGSGGSGGGGAYSGTAGGSGTVGQGNNGGSGSTTALSGSGGGGGGGASAVGGNGSGTVGGNGGAGTASSITGSSVTYAGGGGGSGITNGSGGSGGGAAGNWNLAGISGTANTGGGGGGGGNGYVGGNGGSGVIIISYTSATPKFVGGTLTTSGGNQIHTFTSSGTLSPITPITASYLVVAGGGSGSTSVGYTEASGGGGAGGLLSGSTTIYSGATYVVTVGAGGAGPSTYAGTNNGSNSVLSGTGLTTLTSIGGGAGNADSPGVAGGSGGGGGAAVTSRAGGTGTAGQGNNGGSGFGSGTNSLRSGGGGGGSSAVGANAASAQGGAGGAGTASSITGTSVTYAAGGGGSSQSAGGSGGSSIGGNGQGASPATSTTSGVVNTGSGGGGANNTNGGSGGSGVVIISYAGSQVFNGGLVTSSGGNTIHTFTSTGALTPLTNNLTNSLRFRQSANATLSRTPTVQGSKTTWTWSGWIKRGALNSGVIFASTDAGAIDNNFQFTSGGGIQFINYEISYIGNLITTQVFRDPSAWYHLVVVWDTTQATAANRMRIYVNGNQVTAFSTATYPAQNTEARWNNPSYPNYIFGWQGNQYTTDGYLADVNYIDGQALEPYYFGNNDANGVWKPILYKGTYGTNGFYLTFGNTTSTTTLGYDSSPNGNNWTTNNISLTAGTTYDAMLDVPTNTSATVANYAVMNPLFTGGATLTNGNLSAQSTSAAYKSSVGTITFPTSGKYYLEATIVSNNGSGNNQQMGIADASNTYNFVLDCFYSGSLIRKGVDGVITTGYGTASNGMVIGIAVDATNGKAYLAINNTWIDSSSPTGGTGGYSMTAGIQYFAFFLGYNSGVSAYNFGQRPFSYTPPTGFVALNTFNLPTPTILQGNKYMDATLYTGTGATQVVVNQAQFKPDFVWAKSRSNTNFHNLMDSVRGTNKLVYSNSTAAEDTNAQIYTAINSNGFSVGTDNSANQSGQTFVGWQWQAGQGSTSSNTSGTITSTVSVNTTAGFSIVTYTGNGTSGATIGHGLGVAPKMIIVKSRSSAYGWSTYHASLGATYLLKLNTTAAATNVGVTGYWNNTAPTSTVFSIGNDAEVNLNTATFVAYCWAEIAGFSSFGSYTGNGSADGPFVYLGFRPKFIITKMTSGADEWITLDSARSDVANANTNDQVLVPNSSAAESSGSSYGNPLAVDFLSNGFKIRGTQNANNNSGSTFIYMAFAANPFNNSNSF